MSIKRFSVSRIKYVIFSVISLSVINWVVERIYEPIVNFAWILATGFWSDDGLWKDDSNWID